MKSRPRTLGAGLQSDFGLCPEHKVAPSDAGPKEVKPNPSDVTLLRMMRRDGAMPGGAPVALKPSIQRDRCTKAKWIRSHQSGGYIVTAAGATMLERTDFARG